LINSQAYSHTHTQHEFNLKVKDAILVDLAEVDRDRDAEIGYDLPLSLGIVEKLCHSERRVYVCWMFGKNWTSDWMKWVCPKTKKPPMDWIDDDCIVTRNKGFLIVKMVKHAQKKGYFTLHDDSIRDIIRITQP